MTMQLRGRIRFLVACVAVCAASSTAAQEEAVRIDEILVTAQKIEQNLQSVPIAVTAFTDEQLRVNRIEALVDIAQRTPGFTATEVNPAEPNLVIRGIGTEGIDSNAGGDASVVTFVDGVYIGRGGGANLDLLDLERVEVLRGPQGTLFGKNVVGGLVHLVTRKPSADDFGDIAATFGNFSRIEARGRFNKALSGTVFASGAIVYRKRDGYSFNATTGNDVDDEKISGARAALRLAPSSNLDVVFAIDATRQRQRGKPRDNVCNVTFNNGVHCVGVDPDPRVMNAITDGHLRRDVEGISGEVNWKTGIGTVTSITAYRQAEFDFEDPFFSNPVNPPTQIESINRNVEDSDQFSQELRLAFTALDERLDGIVGAYFLSESIDRDEMLDQRFPAAAQQGRGSFPQQVDSDSTAVFGEIGFDFTSTLRGQLGGRMTWESKDAHLRGIRVAGPGFPPPLAAEYDVTASESWDAFTPRAILEWTAAEQAMIYASAARGFKSGGFQGTAGNGASAVIPYDPEFAVAYEIGAKTEWLGNRLRLNLAAFQIEHKDLQVSQLVPLCCVVIGNAAEAEIEGAELELVARPIPGLDVNGSYTWLDAKFTDFATGATANNTGRTLPRAPEDKYNVGVQYGWSVASWADAFVRVDWTWQSEIFFEASNTPFEIQSSYDLIDARVALRAHDEKWELALWGKNLDDARVKTHIVAFAPFRQELNTYQAPRTYGATLSYSF